MGKGPGNAVDLTGMKFGRLTAIRRSVVKPGCWECLCECGNASQVLPSRLLSGNNRSCGCLRRDNALAAVRTHGMSRTPEFRIWAGMISRCTNPNRPEFKDYGGRGIDVCERWKEGFVNFRDDMGGLPTDKHTIERRDVNGNYCPDNCYWTTKTEQNRNTRRSRWVEHGGKRMILADWARELGIPERTLHYRIADKGMTIAEILVMRKHQKGK